jgi:replicative DNA helicase
MTTKPTFDESFETEYAVLGAMILDNQALIKALDILPSYECFTNPANQILFQTLQKMLADRVQIDTITLAKTLKKDGTYEQVGGASQLGFLAMKVSSAAYVEIHSRIILEQYIRTKINQVVTEGLSKSLNEKEDIFEVA